MPWARIDDAFDDHPKVLAVLEHEQGGAAIGLWTLCLTWAHRNTLKRGKTPGLIAASLPRRYLGPGARELAALLVKEGLWEPLAEGDGWMIHDFEKYLPTEKTREARAEAGRKGAEARWGKSAGRDGTLPSGDSNVPRSDSKNMAPDGKTGRSGPGSAVGALAPPDGSPTDGKVPSGHGNLPSGLPFDDGNVMASDGSRAPAHRAIPKGIAPETRDPVRPTAADADIREATAQTLIGEWIDHCRKRPPDRVIGQIGKELRSLLAEGHAVADVRAGLARWHQAGKHPNTLASFVNEVMNASPSAGRPSTTDERTARTQALKDKIRRDGIAAPGQPAKTIPGRVEP